jgi:transposase
MGFANRRMLSWLLWTAEFDKLYADSGRTPIAPEYVTRALLSQVFYSICSERLLVEKGFGGLQQAGPPRKVKLRKIDKVD